MSTFARLTGLIQSRDVWDAKAAVVRPNEHNWKAFGFTYQDHADTYHDAAQREVELLSAAVPKVDQKKLANLATLASVRPNHY